MSEEESKPEEEYPFADTINLYLGRFYMDRDQIFRRIRPNIWKIYEHGYDFDIIQTSKLVVMDALLFDETPEEPKDFFEELLALNALKTKACKLCMEKGEIRLRLIRQVTEVPFEAFEENLTEFRHLFDEFRNLLMPKYFTWSRF